MINKIPNELLDFASMVGRKKFLCECDSGIYEGVNVKGEPVRVFRQRGSGMKVCTKHLSKPKWWEVVYYDEDGIYEGESYEPV